MSIRKHRITVLSSGDFAVTYPWEGTENLILEVTLTEGVLTDVKAEIV